MIVANLVEIIIDVVIRQHRLPKLTIISDIVFLLILKF